jgi:hypothetical protein
MLKFSTLAVVLSFLPASGLPVLAQPADSKSVNTRVLGDRNVAPAARPGASAGSMKPCPEYGAGFYRLAGSDTCVRLGGAVGTDIGTSSARR